jgi:hypothetical protein
MSAAPADDASTVRTAERDAQRAWVIGGAALAASAVVPAISGPGAGPWVGYAGRILLLAAFVVLALGVRGHGSVTARRPLGTTALISLGAVPFVMVLVSNLALASVVTMSTTPAGGGIWTAAVVVNTVSMFVTLALAIIAVVQIARAGEVPKPWNLAPLWVLISLVAVEVISYVVGVTTPDDQSMLVFVFEMARIVRVIGPAFLGILAIVLAVRLRRPASVPVYRGSGAPD